MTVEISQGFTVTMPAVETVTTGTSAQGYAGANDLVTVVFVFCGVLLVVMVSLLFSNKNCKIFHKGQQNPRVRLLESSTDEEGEAIAVLTPRKPSRTTSFQGVEIKLEDEIEMYNIRQPGKKENTAPVIKAEENSNY